MRDYESAPMKFHDDVLKTEICHAVDLAMSGLDDSQFCELRSKEANEEINFYSIKSDKSDAVDSCRNEFGFVCDMAINIREFLPIIRKYCYDSTEEGRFRATRNIVYEWCISNPDVPLIYLNMIFHVYDEEFLIKNDEDVKKLIEDEIFSISFSVERLYKKICDKSGKGNKNFVNVLKFLYIIYRELMRGKYFPITEEGNH